MRRALLLLLLIAVPATAGAGPLIDPAIDVDIPAVDDTLRLKQMESVAAAGQPDVGWLRGDLGPLAGLSLDVSQVPGDRRANGLRLGGADSDVTAIGLTLRGTSPSAVQPYVGLGPTVFFTRSVAFDARAPRRPSDLSLADGAVADRVDASLGLQAQAGVRLSLTPNLDLFGEYRFMRPTYEMPGRVEGDALGPASLTNSHYFQGGLSIRF
jgi:hypothetical protein